MASSPVLDLNTLTAPIRPVVIIDGQRHPLLPPDMLSVLDYRRIDRITARLQALWNAPEITDEAEAEVTQLCDSLCRIVLEAPADVHGRLTDIQRIAVYNAFQELPQANLRLVGATQGRGKTSTGATSPRASRGSTVARRTTGSRARRSA